MSFRPTISVRFGDEIAGISYCRNWEEHHLLIEAVAIAAAYRDCQSVAEYRIRRYGAVDFNYVLEPELIPNTQENLRELEDISEFPVVVDLKAKAIYCSYGSIPEKWLRRKPARAGEDRPNKPRLSPKGIWQTNFYRVMEHGVFLFEEMDLPCIRDMIVFDPEMQELVTEHTLRELKCAA